MERLHIELEEAVSTILEHTRETTAVSQLPLFECMGRVLAEKLVAELDSPPFDRSPLDGYTFASECTKEACAEQPKALTVIDTVYAGGYRGKPVDAGCAVRIMTGAPIPAGCDCVIRLEDVETLEDQVLIPMEMKHHENYCFRGEDFKAGTCLLEKGTRLGAAELGVLASAGKCFAQVYDRCRVVLLVSGDEVVEPGTDLLPGKIYDSNLYLLYGKLKQLGAEVVLAKVAGDDPKRIADLLTGEIRAESVDAIITTGGVSVGDKDIFHEVLPMMGAERLFWRVNLKPGTPAMFSVCEGIPMLNLSGNPFAAAATFDLLAVPMIEKISRYGRHDGRERQAVLDTAFLKASKGRRFLRGVYEDGHVWIPSTEKHASGILSSMAGCNCLIDVPAGTGALKQGDRVRVVLTTIPC